MPRKPTFKIQKNNSGWMVNVPASLTKSGKRERHFHQTRDLAKKHAAKLRDEYTKHGAGASAISPTLAEDAAKAAKILKPWGLSLTEAAQQIALKLESDQASKLIEDAKAAWLESLCGLRPRSIKSYTLTVNRLQKALPGRLMATITADEISEAIKSPGVTVATNSLHRRNARVFWNWCAHKGWCDKSVFDKVEKPRKSQDKEISFLSPDQVEDLLYSAQTNYPSSVCMYAIALFAGVRSEELRKLQPHHVDEEGINLPADITKKGRRRYITLTPTLKAWLTAYPFTPCPNWRHVDCAVRRLAGWDVAADLLKDPPPPSRGRWPQNALRHTHASYAIASGVGLESMLFEFGHVGGVETLRKHYLGRATKSQAKQFFNLRPKNL